MSSTIRFLATAGLFLASTAHAQSSERALLSRFSIGSVIAAARTAQLSSATSEAIGERALLGRVESRSRDVSSDNSTTAPIDGARALLGRPAAVGSSFRARVQGDIATSASGQAEFGSVENGEADAALVLSLGARDGESAILFTRVNGAPLAVGRYRITDGAMGTDEIQALVTTGSPTSPTGVFRGASGWLEVTAASDHRLVGEFQVEGVGFLAADPAAEDRPVSVSGSFSALSAERAL
jgi:hypothetical protein